MDIDVIGLIFQEVEGEEVELVPEEGWHVNITLKGLEEMPELAEFVVEPSTLRRVWAGDDFRSPAWTVPLKFESEEQAKTLLGLNTVE